ncbi:hypothetical protein C6P42_000180 [Pichia californica]|nr:hypothetical protein C6P42_000180 [[Candida] californica]
MDTHNINMSMPTTGNGTTKLQAAVTAMKTALAEIIDTNNYLNANINDPYVNFAFSIYSKYNNDLDFHNAMTFPIQLPASLSSLDVYQNITSSQFQHQSTIPISQNLENLVQPQNSSYANVPSYIHSENTPYLFSVFPPFLYLPLESFGPSILFDDVRFDRLCFIGSTLFEYLVKITLYKKESKFTPDDIMRITKSIVNASSLSILCQAYNIEFNYKFIGYSTPGYKLFLAFLGQYYEEKIDSGNSESDWELMFRWIEQLLGYQAFTDTSPPKAHISISHEKKIEKNIETENDAVLKYLGHEKPNSNDNFKLQDFIQSVQQDLNQSICASAEITYTVDEHPELKSGMFTCILFVNGTETSSSKALNKKLAKSGAALFAAIDRNMIKNLKRSYHDFWTKKYINKENIIRKAFSLDPRFEYVDVELLSSSDSKSEVTTALELDENKSTMSPIPYHPILDKDKNDIMLSTAKEKLYAYYNSKFGIVPKYEYQQLGNSKFKADLFLGNKLMSSAVATSKKDASAKAALQVIEQNSDAF